MDLFKKEALILLRFSAVGLMATALHYAVALSLLWFLSVNPQTANLVAFLTAFGFSYICHSRFTFRSAKAARSSGPRFLITAGSAYLISAAVLAVLAGSTNLSQTVQLIIAAGVIPMVTYLAGRFWVF